MGLFGSICSGISSFCSSVCSGVSSALSSAASWAGSALSSIACGIGNAICGIGSFASNLLKGLGIFKENDSEPEEWGDRAIQAEQQQIFPNQFDDFDDYLDALRNFELDPEKSKESNLEQKIFKGLEVAGRALEAKFNAPEGSMADVFVLHHSNPEYFTSERFQSLLSSGTSIVDIATYFEGRVGGAEALNIEDKLVDIDQNAHPEKDENISRHELYDAVDTSQNTLRNLGD